MDMSRQVEGGSIIGDAGLNEARSRSAGCEAVGETRDVAGRAAELAGIAEEITERLLGCSSSLAGAAENDPRPPISGMFSEITDSAADAKRGLNRIASALQRLQGAL